MSEPLAKKDTKEKHAPSRDDILAFISRETEAGGPRKIGVREIARAFGLAGEGRIAIKRMLAELAEEGVLEKRGKRVTRKGALPPVALVDIIARDRDGE
ncbi:MAG: ribonuclease R, partial [Alphaproteobacteria bacterium]|nr:ribonuclease R [Alphaproteobacteria bacterium]